MCAAKEFSKDHPRLTVSEMPKEFRSCRSSGVTEWGENDGVSCSGGEGEAFGKPLQSSSSFVVVLDLFCTQGGVGIDWRSTSCQEKRKKRGPDCKCRPKGRGRLVYVDRSWHEVPGISQRPLRFSLSGSLQRRLPISSMCLRRSAGSS